MSADGSVTEDLLRLAGQADQSALARLLDRHRLPHCRRVAAGLDKRLAPRVDPSDIVQDALIDAGAGRGGSTQADGSLAEVRLSGPHKVQRGAGGGFTVIVAVKPL